MPVTTERGTVKGQTPRLGVALTRELEQIVESTARDTGQSRPDVIRDAVKLYGIVRREAKRGKHFGFASNPDSLDVRVVGLGIEPEEPEDSAGR